MAKKSASTKSKSTKRSTTKKTTKKKSSPKQRKSSASTRTKKKAAPDDQEVTIDRRDNDPTDRRDDGPTKSPPKIERREKVQRRRQIDPTTCERDYTDAEVAFMNAMNAYKRKSGRMFPTCSEVLEVVRSLGYVQLTPAELAARGDSEEEQPVEAVAVEETL